MIAGENGLLATDQSQIDISGLVPNADGNLARHAVGRDQSGRVLTRATVFYDNVGGPLLQERLRYTYSPRGVDQIEKEAPYDSGTYVPHQDPGYDAAGNRTGSTVGLDNRLLNTGTVLNGTTYAYDKEGRVIQSRQSATFGTSSSSETMTVFRYDQRGRLVEVTATEDFTSNGATTTTVTMETNVYDPLNRRVERTVTVGNTTTHTAYIYDGSAIVGELDIAGATVTTGGVTHTPGEIVRMNLLGPSGELLATNQARSGIGTTPTETLWGFADQTGTITSWARFDGSLGNNLVEVRHEQFDTFGGYVAAFGSTTGVLTQAETIFQGWRQDPVTGLFEAQGRLYDPANNRFTTQGSVSPESPNPYLLGNNDPLNKGRDWSKLEGPGAFGTWGSIGYGLGDTLTFGLVADPNVRAQTNGGYWVGAALGIGVQIASGAWAANALRGVGGARAALGAWSTLTGAERAAVGFAGYALLGDTIGVGQSTAHAIDGTFTPLDLLGFVPTIGWASQAYRGARGAGRGVTSLTRANGFVVDFADDVVDAGGVPYGTERLESLRRYLGRRNVTLEIDSPELPRNKAGAFKPLEDGTARMLLRSDTSSQVVWHELGHYLHWKKLGPEAYRALPRVFGNNVPEQFVFDLLQQPGRWDRLTPKYRLHMVDEIEVTWGGMGR